jgi:transposase
MSIVGRSVLGLDVSDRFTSYCLIDPLGELIQEGRLKTERAALSRLIQDGFRVVVEAGTHSPWIARLFDEAGCEVVVANPRRVQLIAQSTRKNDRSDAETLARLGRADPQLLAPISHRSEQAQADLASIRARNALVASRTLLINHVRGAAKTVGTRIPNCDAHTFHKRAHAALPHCLVPGLSALLDAIAELTRQIKVVDAMILELIETRYPTAKLLQQVAGVGPLISLTFILTIGDPARFRKSRDIGPYLGLVPLQRESGSSSPELRISKTGDKYLRQLLVSGAQYILGYRGPDCDLRRWGLRHAGQGKTSKKRAVVGVARRLAILLHRLWVTGEVYEPLRAREVAA